MLYIRRPVRANWESGELTRGRMPDDFARRFENVEGFSGGAMLHGDAPDLAFDDFLSVDHRPRHPLLAVLTYRHAEEKSRQQEPSILVSTSARPQRQHKSAPNGHHSLMFMVRTNPQPGRYNRFVPFKHPREKRRLIHPPSLSQLFASQP